MKIIVHIEHHALGTWIRLIFIFIGFVNMSAFHSPVLITSMLIQPSSTWCLKWRCSRAACFVLGVKVGHFTIFTQLSLSSNSLNLIIGTGLLRFNFDDIFLTIFIIGIKYLRHIDNAEHEASVDYRAILVYYLMHCATGKSNMKMICPTLENIL